MSDGKNISESVVAEPTQQVMQILGGLWVARMVSVAAELGIADIIGEGQKTTEELAAATKTHAPSLYRLMRGLAGAGVFREDGHGVWTSTPLGKVLRSNVPGSMRSTAITTMGQEHFAAWGALANCIKTGETGVKHVFGKEIWDYFRENPEHAKNFDQCMVDFSAGVNAALLQAYDFGGIDHLVDVGGGQGGVITAVLQKYPKLRGTLFDQKYVVEGAERTLNLAGVSDRCARVGGDFFESLPAGADAYLMKFILHDWDDEKSLAILKNIRRAIVPTGKLIVVDIVIPEGNGADWGKLMDVHMTGGMERTEAQFKELLDKSGFRLTRVVPTESPLSIIEALPV
ncbi:MAG TPA: methyltransferase [Tepidisphaeraceae bacterium]|nr:methyltransferase [Tepidisphaeraceae bacterium]